jgi:hypothetical protein
MVVRFALDEKLETLILLHEEAFTEIGGAPPRMTYDNMTTVGRHVGPGEVWLKCHHGYGCMETPGTPGCKGCACEKCVCETDEYCCTDEWDGKCAWACKAICGGCVPCTDCGEPGPEEGLPDAPDAPDDAEVSDVPTAEVVEAPPGGEDAAGDSPAAPDESATADSPVADGPADVESALPDSGPSGDAPPEAAGDTSPEPIGDPGGASGEPTRLDAGARGGGACSPIEGVPTGWTTCVLLVLAMGSAGCARLRRRC